MLLRNYDLEAPAAFVLASSVQSKFIYEEDWFQESIYEQRGLTNSRLEKKINALLILRYFLKDR